MQEVVVSIDGMMCGMCESHVNNVIRNNFNVKKVTSSHSKGRTVIITEEDIDEKKLREKIDETGYSVTDIKKQPYEKKGLFSFLKK
ncbi:heavy-metal-associated domain-containing protein [Anaerostipes sp. MSJ-23]|uniref:heavy-metal-associated domain-containing protein n=1 Tax=unclassified Anaerostipes TaxID=2635253 RepID=UPI001C11637F|nr:heavy-metal-associated domain-containing protein [Anaerostipes sp. MSJ-23]MBU5460494.1 cation transporter [Anaerostipes sp. MSJ-23]